MMTLPDVRRLAIGRWKGPASVFDMAELREERSFQIAVRPRRVIVGLYAVFIVLFAIALLPWVHSPESGNDLSASLHRLFAFGQEANIPTLFSSALLASVAAVLLSVGSTAESRRPVRTERWRWRVLGGIFGFLAVDEMAMIHEILNDYPMGSTGLLAVLDSVPWIWFYGFGVIAVAAMWCPVLRRLPLRTAMSSIIAAGFYLGGAICLELVGAYIRHSGYPLLSPHLPIIIGIVQELMKTFGTLVFLTAMLDYRTSLEQR